MSKKFSKIVYVTSTRMPTEKAHGLATVKLAEAIASLGSEVDIICPKLWRKNNKNTFDYYGVKNNFKIIKVWVIDLMPLKFFEKFLFLIQVLTFSLFSTFYCLFKYWREDVIYFSHDYIPLYFLTFISKNVFYDIHHYPGNNFMYKRLMSKAFAFAVQTRWKIKELNKDFNIDESKIVYWPNGTDVDQYNIALSKFDVRNKLNLPQDKKIVLYTGQLFDWKGGDTLIRSITKLNEDAIIYIVGGAKNDVERLKNNIPDANDERVVFIPFQSREKMPLWMKAANVLVIPNTGKQKVSLYYTSPMKLFEYMASNRPIVASKLPSIMEVLHETNALLIEPEDVSALRAGITFVFNNQEESNRRAEEGKRTVVKYTWEKRGASIADFIHGYSA